MTCRDEDVTDLSHEAKVQKTDSDDHETIKKPVTESQSEKIAEAQSDNILQTMTELFSSVELLGAKMDSRVKNLEDKMNEGFKD